MIYNKGSIECKIESIVQEIERLTWENDGKQPTIIAVIPIKFKENYCAPAHTEYEITEVKIIYQI